jgi:hypothetical protein
MRSFIYLTLTLASTATAQAADTGAAHINTQKWITTYAAEAEVDGLPVLATLDESPIGLEIPAEMVNIPGDSTLVPSLNPVVKKRYRLNLIVSRQPLVQMSYPVESRRVSIDGAVRFAYVSDLTPTNDIQFLITSESDGTLRVQYNRKLSEGMASGEFALAPVPHILSK